jgi:CDP-glucose 4,6-dehydratase
LWGGNASWRRDTGIHPHEAHYLKLDASKARTYLDWHPLLSLNDALAWIVEWYRAFQASDDLRGVVHRQIERYEELTQGKI